MPSVIEEILDERESFLRRYRTIYLASLCSEMGITVDLREMALREAGAMIELARELMRPPGK
jgi:hypothetical protein